MDWKDYRVAPDEGLFEKIERRAVHRRRLRTAGAAACALAVAGVAVWLALPPGRAGEAAGMPADAVAVAEVPAVDVALPASAVGQAADAPAEPLPDAVVPAPSVAEAELEAAVPPVQEPVAAISVAEVPVVAEKEGITEVREPEAPAAPAEQLFDIQPAMDDAPAADAGKGPVVDTAQQHYEAVLWAPNIIIPNGDVDENRMFRVRAAATVSEFSLMIFNRAGRVVFSTNDMMQEWDGSYSGGAVPQGAYVWVARFRDNGGVLRQETGTVTVVR